MKNYILLAVTLLLPVLLICFASAAAELPMDLGQDSDKLAWGIWDYGAKEDGAPFVVARKYYSNKKIKDSAIDLLMIELLSIGRPPQAAGELYFTEYEYEYTRDGKQFAVTYIRHYDGAGGEIHTTVYDGSTEALKKTFVDVGVGPKSTLGAEQGVYLALPELTPSSEKK